MDQMEEPEETPKDQAQFQAPPPYVPAPPKLRPVRKYAVLIASPIVAGLLFAVMGLLVEPDFENALGMAPCGAILGLAVGALIYQWRRVPESQLHELASSQESDSPSLSGYPRPTPSRQAEEFLARRRLTDTVLILVFLPLLGCGIGGLFDTYYRFNIEDGPTPETYSSPGIIAGIVIALVWVALRWALRRKR